jgi:hypothetical protein
VLTPDDTTLLSALQAFRSANPTTGRAKVLQQLRSENGWILSEKRLKNVMDAHNLNAVDVEARKAKEAEEKKEAENALPKLPPNPLQAQLKYKDESTRYIKLYGNGKYDFGITPNADMGVFIDVIAFPFLY